MKIHVFTIATGIYSLYLPYLAKSLNNIYPTMEKTFNVISDCEFRLCLSDEIYNEYKESNYCHIANLPYPFVTYFKTQFVCDMIMEKKYSLDDYFIFCDADSYFIKKEGGYYEKIFTDGKLHCAISPWIDDENRDIVKEETINNKNSKSYFGEVDKYSFPNYIQASLFFGKIEKLLEVNKYIMSIIASDKNGYANMGYIPTMADQTLLNKYVYENPNEVITEHYISNSYWWDGESNDHFSGNITYDKYKDEVFCIQKFKGELKSQKRYSDKFEYNI